MRPPCLIESEANRTNIQDGCQCKPGSVLPIEWTRLLKDNPELTMKDVDTFVKLNKAPQSGIVKGFKFFCEGFIKDYDGVCACMGKLAKQGVEFLSRY